LEGGGRDGGEAFIVEKKDVGRAEAESIPSRRRRGKSGGQEQNARYCTIYLKEKRKKGKGYRRRAKKGKRGIWVGDWMMVA
jgi:hypothetical protein